MANKPNFTTTEDKIIFLKGGSIEDIAKALGRTKASIANRRQHLLLRMSSMKLSKKEVHILKLISEGNTDKVIGKLYGRSSRTIEEYRKAIIIKLGAKNTAHAVRLGFIKKYLKK